MSGVHFFPMQAWSCNAWVLKFRLCFSCFSVVSFHLCELTPIYLLRGRCTQPSSLFAVSEHGGRLVTPARTVNVGRVKECVDLQALQRFETCICFAGSNDAKISSSLDHNPSQGVLNRGIERQKQMDYVSLCMRSEVHCS